MHVLLATREGEAEAEPSVLPSIPRNAMATPIPRSPFPAPATPTTSSPRHALASSARGDFSPRSPRAAASPRAEVSPRAACARAEFSPRAGTSFGAWPAEASAAPSTRLSLSHAFLRRRYDVIVIGSGYGGSIAALRAAQHEQTVCVLEKGKEKQPGEYPETNEQVRAELNVEHHAFGALTPDRRGSLYQMSFGSDISILYGSGLGGTSQINASVALDADPRVWQAKEWPEEVRTDHQSGQLEQDWAEAERMLKPKPVPAAFMPVKIGAMRAAAEALRTEEINSSTPGDTPVPPIEDFHYRVPLAVNWESTSDNGFGVRQPACNGCGNCLGGCNTGAKNTLIMNYLPEAVRFGASIFVEMTVVRIEPVSDDWRKRNEGTEYERCNWRVHVRYGQHDWAPFGERSDVLHAEFVFLGGGVLGTTKLLLQSSLPDTSSDKATPLQISAQIGQQFSGNGDVIGFAAKTRHRTQLIGYDADEISKAYAAADDSEATFSPGMSSPNSESSPPTAPGPCITTVIDYRFRSDLHAGFIIQDGTAPSNMAFVSRLLLAAAQGAQAFTRLNVNSMKYSLALLSIGHDTTSGVVRLSKEHPDVVNIHWPGAGLEAWVPPVTKAHEKAAKAMGGQHVPCPLSKQCFNHGLLTTHPLGGAVMADRAENGVAAHNGAVFSTASGQATHSTLFIVDAALIPRSVGVNPVRTICTLAERIMRLCAAHFNWPERLSAPPTPGVQSKPVASDPITAFLPSSPNISGVAGPWLSATERVEAVFSETMRGFTSQEIPDIERLQSHHWSSRAWREFHHQVKHRPGLDRAEKDDNHPAHGHFVLSISMPDVALFLSQPPHKAFVHPGGQVLLNQVSTTPFRVVQGRFTLFNDSPTESADH